MTTRLSYGQDPLKICDNTITFGLIADELSKWQHAPRGSLKLEDRNTTDVAYIQYLAGEIGDSLSFESVVRGILENLERSKGLRYWKGGNMWERHLSV